MFTLIRTFSSGPSWLLLILNRNLLTIFRAEKAWYYADIILGVILLGLGVLKADNEANSRGSDEDEATVNCSAYGSFIGGMVDWLGLASNAPTDGDGLDGLRVYVIDLIYNFGDVYH